MFFKNLNEDLIPLMLNEVDMDIEENSLYLSPRLTELGKTNYPNILKNSIIKLDLDFFINSLNSRGILKLKEERHTNGILKMVKVPKNAANLIAEGEFNKFYIRALCLKAISKNIKLKVYRAKDSKNPRPDSELKIGAIINPSDLLKDLRETKGIESHLKLPNGYNSGLSVCFI